MDLTDEAKEAIRSLLQSRGLDESILPPLALAARKAAYRQTKGWMECDFCGSWAGRSAVVDGGQRFCRQACLREARLLEISEDIPTDMIFQHACRIKQGSCSLCKKASSTTEVRPYYRVWSIGILTRWTKRTHICCHSCGRKTNFACLIFSFAFGWWGMPWGLIITPAQIISNLAEMFRSRADATPSDALLRAARLDLASKLHQHGTAQSDS
ncbi:hypothetical protein [Chromobacterium subtsugae]|uniref:hypothetical protein n=1 Tax=Chromobacterium subtsugae TaxID=251747 RepID=UPI00069B1D86|nr:hypothetical protein [Chromobacterium subtsugae]